MNADNLIAELGKTLGIELLLSAQGTARVEFDADIVDFEKLNDKLYIMADIGSCVDRKDAYEPILTANNFGIQTGGAFIGIDLEREVFTMTLVEGDVNFTTFESDLTRFIKVLCWWKAWLDLPPMEDVTPSPEAVIPSFDSNMIRI